MELHLRFIGAAFIVLALVHSIFPRYFKWAEDLRPLSLINRQMMVVHTFFIALAVLLMGALCLSVPDDLTQTALGKKIMLGFGIFWGARFVTQFAGYSAELWRGKPFETTVHIVFSLFWFYVTAVFLLVALR
jgi:hypothetical protein